MATSCTSTLVSSHLILASALTFQLASSLSISQFGFDTADLMNKGRNAYQKRDGLVNVERDHTVHRRNATNPLTNFSRLLCEAPSSRLSPSLLPASAPSATTVDLRNSPDAACLRDRHPKCSISYSWTDDGCEVDARCRGVHIDRHDVLDSSLCWIQARAFPYILSGNFYVTIHASGNQPDLWAQHSFYRNATAAPQTLQQIMDVYRATFTVTNYNVVVHFPMAS